MTDEDTVILDANRMRVAGEVSSKLLGVIPLYGPALRVCWAGLGRGKG